MALERDLDRGPKVTLLVGLEEVAVGLRLYLGAHQHGVLGVRREKDNRRGIASADGGGRDDAVVVVLQTDVHQDQVGVVRLHGFERLGRRSSGDRHVVAEADQGRLDVMRDQRLVLDHQDRSRERALANRARRIHGFSHAVPRCRSPRHVVRAPQSHLMVHSEGSPRNPWM